MSERAAAYYEERAARLGIAVVPPFLSGRPVQLLENDQYLSIQSPKDSTVEQLSQNIGTVTQTLHDYIHLNFQNMPSNEYANVPYGEHALQTSNKAVLQKIGSVITPKSIKAGTLTDFWTDAIARSEVHEPTLHKIKHNTTAFSVCNIGEDEGENTEVYVHMRANLTSGSRTIQVAGLLLVRAAYHRKRTYVSGSPYARISPQYLFRGYDLNEKLGSSIIAETLTISDIVQEYRLRTAYQSPAGTGKRAHGKH